MVVVMTIAQLITLMSVTKTKKPAVRPLSGTAKKDMVDASMACSTEPITHSLTLKIGYLTQIVASDVYVSNHISQHFVLMRNFFYWQNYYFTDHPEVGGGVTVVGSLADGVSLSHAVKWRGINAYPDTRL